MRQLLTLRALAFGLWITCGLPLVGQQPPPSGRVVKVSSGPSGQDVNGTFALTSERSIFNRKDDREVIVLFQWDGVAGPHRLVAQWRSPDNAATSVSAIDYVARAARFGAYWSLPLSATMQLGTWSIEATVDGVPAGRFTFEITDATVASPQTKPLLTQAALYERLSRGFVVLRRYSKAGRELNATSGFSSVNGLIYTAMSTLDNADDIRVVSRGGTVKPMTSVVAWNRRQHWAVLSGTAETDVQPIPAAVATSVGTRCFSLDSARDSSRVLSECSITGENTEGAGTSWVATFLTGKGIPGAPVLNEFGELIGIVGDLGPTGATTTTVFSAGESTRVTPIVPTRLINVNATAPPVALLDLQSQAVTAHLVVGDEHVMSGGFGRVDAKGKLVAPEHHYEMPLREIGFAVFVMWSPRERLRGQMMVRVFDADNHVVTESKSAKVDIRKAQTLTSFWSLPMLANPGVYRADVLLDATPIWRGFVRITS